MEEKKEKINWKFVFAVAIPISIVISILSLFMIGILIRNTSDNCGRS